MGHVWPIAESSCPHFAINGGVRIGEEMENASNLIRKAIYIYEANSKETTQAYVSITVPTPISDIDGDHYCHIEFKRQLSSPKKIIGVDGFHVLTLAIKLLENLLSATYDDFEVRDASGEKYVTPFSL